ncbi:MAG: cysteine desulfurase, partial [Rhodothermales bacterium]|nr:cysteine desulfurase [Rhodothermales bacterium]
ELPVDENGLVSGDDVRAGLRDDTILVAVMWANNETGVIHPMDEIVQAVADHQAFLFSDATQAAGKVPVSMDGVDLLACSAHKFYGPKGAGALLIRTQSPPIRLPKLLHGGAQESGRRSGTLNVPGIVGMGAAAQIASERLEKDAAAMRSRRDRFEQGLLEIFPEAFVNGAGAERLPQTSNVSFPGVKAGDMISEIGRLAVSTGSACASGSGAPSHVLSAMGLTKEQAQGTVRFSMGRHTTDDEVDSALELLGAYARRHGLVSAPSTL